MLNLLFASVGLWSTLANGVAVASRTSTTPSPSISSPIVSFDVGFGSKAAQHLDRQLISMSIEFCYIPDFLGTPAAPNKFSKQLLQNIQDISGAPPILRLGGNTQDLAKYCENCPETLNNTFEAGNSEAINVTFSKKLFQVMNENMPSNTKYIFGLNFGQDNVEIPKSELAGALKHLHQSKLIAYELGNEPDHYVNFRGKSIRPQDWGVLQYVQQTTEWLSQLSAGQRFQYGSVATNPVLVGDFTMVQAIKLRILQMVKGIQIISSHSYVQNACTPANAALVKLEDYLNHLKTVQFWSAYTGEIAAAKAIGATFHIGETGSVACHGKDGVSNTMGALLWAIDYSLYMATLGADRMFFHNGKGDFFYSMWEPLALNSSYPAHINPQYYSMLLLAEVVSDLKAPRVYRVAALDTFDLAHYAIYDHSKLQKMVIMNMAYYNGTTETRPSKSVDVSPVLGRELKYKRLTAENTIAKKGVTWGAQSVDANGRIVGVKNVEKSSNGVITLLASEAVVIERAG